MATVVLFVAVWWTANLLATIASKKAMSGNKPDFNDSRTTWASAPPAFKDLRWIELTMLQHLLGALLAGTWLLVVRGKSVIPKDSLNRKHVLLAVTGNLVGNLATNASFAAVSSSLTQVIKSCEPVVTFVFTLLFYKKSDNLTCNALLSVIAMVAGTCLFISGEVSFNIWGIGAAVISNIGFPIRNIYLKKSSESWDGPLQKFAVVSTLSVFFLLPFAIFKMSSIEKLPAVASFASATFHLIYNAASITVLQTVSPVEHAILNLSKRMFVIVANMIVFSTAFTSWTVVGLLVIFIGHYSYREGHDWRKINVSLPKIRNCLGVTIILGSVAFCCFLALFQSAAPIISKMEMRLSHDRPIEVNAAAWIHDRQIQNNVLGNMEAFMDRNPNLPAIESSGTTQCVKSTQDLKNPEITNDRQTEVVTTAWVYDRPIPSNVLKNIEAFVERNPGMTVKVFCGTSQCMNATQDLENPKITGEFLVLPEIFTDTHLEQWLVYHPIHKILTGIGFEDHVYEAVRLALLWRHGGIHFDPLIKLREYTAPRQKEAWVSIGRNFTKKTATYGLLSVSRFPVYSPFITKLIEVFCREYSRNITKRNPKFPQQFDFQRLVVDMNNQFCQSGNDCPTRMETELERISEAAGRKRHYGTLFYNRRVALLGRGRANIGDEIQGIPGVQFLPFVDRFIERDNLNQTSKDGRIRMFLNAWYGAKKMVWPPPANIDPVLLSMHIQPQVRPLFAKFINYLQDKGPVGCRDSDTLEFLRQNGVDAFLSGCSTLLIQSPNILKQRSDKVYFVDVNQSFIDLLPSHVKEKGIRGLHYRRISSNKERFKVAYNLIRNYSEARVVVTQRIHCALPCVAVGTPVIFINSRALPGGGGTARKASPRVTGLTPLFHTIDAHNMSLSSVAQWLRDFNWRNPPPNPNVDLRMRLQATQWNVIRHDQVLYDNARKFGLLPLWVPATNTSNQ